MTGPTSIRTMALAALCLLFAIAGGLVATYRSEEPVSLDSVLEVWADLARDVDRVGLTVTRVSTKREMEIGREIAREIERNKTHGRAIRWREEYVTNVGEMLAKNVRREGIIYSFKVLDTPMVNAYAIPGGHVYVTKGMLDFLESEAELAAVLGHEISHVDLKHCIERLQYELVARKVIGSDLATIVQVGYLLYGLGFSEQQELEADVGGMILAAKAGYDPRAAIAVFERMAAIERPAEEPDDRPTFMVGEIAGALAKVLESYFDTHPPSELRVRRLEQAVERNTRAWRNQRFYVGRRNHSGWLGRWSVEHPDEWRVYAPE